MRKNIYNWIRKDRRLIKREAFIYHLETASGKMADTYNRAWHLLHFIVFCCLFTRGLYFKSIHNSIIYHPGNLLAFRCIFPATGHPATDITIFMDIARNPGPDDTMDNYGSLDLPRKALTICHCNVSSLGNKLDEIKLLLSSSSNCTNNRPNFILGLSETHLNDSWTDASLQVKNFRTFRRDRVRGNGGGLLVYVPSHLPIKRNMNLVVNGLESISLQLQFKNSRPCLFTSVCKS